RLQVAGMVGPSRPLRGFDRMRSMHYCNVSQEQKPDCHYVERSLSQARSASEGESGEFPLARASGMCGVLPCRGNTLIPACPTRSPVVRTTRMRTTAASKVVDLSSLLSLCDAHRRAGRVVVWTNGCFDLFHAGHARSLHAASLLGDVLVVGVNSDESVRRLK